MSFLYVTMSITPHTSFTIANMFGNPTAFLLPSLFLFSLSSFYFRLFFLLFSFLLLYLSHSSLSFHFFSLSLKNTPLIISCLPHPHYPFSIPISLIVEATRHLLPLPSLSLPQLDLSTTYAHSSEYKDPPHSLFYEPTLNASTRSHIFLTPLIR